MIGLIVYVTACFGFAYVVGHSVITKRPREWLFDFGHVFPPAVWLVLLLECPACLGAWVGFAAGFWWPVADFPRAIVVLGAAFFTAGSNFLLGRITGLMPHPNPE